LPVVRSNPGDALAHDLLPNQLMRAFLIFAIIAILGVFYFWQKHNETPPVEQKPTVSTAQLTPAPRGQASEYNWMKRSIDRARDVTEKSRAQTKESQDP
jgi:hypothetical protein